MNNRKYKKVFSQWFIFIIGHLSSALVFAGVYQCVKENGQIEFRDHPCQSSLEQQHFLPYVYQKTDAKKTVKKAQTLKKAQKQFVVEEKRRLRAALRQNKLAEQKALKTKRRLERCTRNQEKIKLIEKKLRAGCTLRRCQTLKQQLAHCEKMKGRYCSTK